MSEVHTDFVETADDFVVSNSLADYMQHFIFAQLGIYAIESFDGAEKFLEVAHLSFAFSDTYIVIASHKDGVTFDIPFESQSVTDVVNYMRTELNIK